MTKRVKTVLITGGSKGIGKAIANDLREHQLILVARSEKELSELCDTLNNQGGKAEYFICDLAQPKQIEKTTREIIEKYHTIDVLINNAGIGLFKRVDQFSLEEFHHIYQVNLLATFQFTRAFVPGMIDKKQGQIINISSVAGLNGFKTGTAYSSSKFAMNGFTESLREDLKGYGIAVTAVCPGAVATGFAGKSPEAKAAGEYALTPEDVAHTVRYLIEQSETANTKMIELKPRRRKEFR